MSLFVLRIIVPGGIIHDGLSMFLVYRSFQPLQDCAFNLRGIIIIPLHLLHDVALLSLVMWQHILSSTHGDNYSFFVSDNLDDFMTLAHMLPVIWKFFRR